MPTTPRVSTIASPTYRTDNSTPGIVLGTAGLGGAWGPVDEASSVKTILYALEAGIERIDTAPAYNVAEVYVGQALARWRGKRPFVSTKVGKEFAQYADVESNNYDIQAMANSLKQSQERLGGRLDLVFLHEPERVADHPTAGYGGVARVVTWLNDIRGGEQVANVGLGGYTTPAYHAAIRAGVFSTVMSFNNLDAVCLDGLVSDIPFFKECGLATYQGSALHMGLLGNRLKRYLADPPDWMTQRALNNAARVAGLADYAGMPLAELAHRYLLSIEEVDHLVIGARNQQQLISTLSHLEKGKLPQDLYNQVTLNTLSHGA